MPNIDTADPGALGWDNANVQASLDSVLRYVESEAGKAIEWYWRNKRWKARMSRWMQLAAIILTALGGLFPILATLVKNMNWPYLSESGLWPSLFVGLAASLFGIDRTFGFSTGWARYVLTASSLRKSLEEFRMDWILLAANASDDQVKRMIERAKDFRLTVESLVMQETKDWATEFQNNVGRMEREVNAQLEALKAHVEKAREAETAAAQPGSIELTVVNAEQSDGFAFEVALDGATGAVTRDKVTNTNKWVYLNATPGQYKLSVHGSIGGKAKGDTTVVVVNAKEVAKPALTLPA